MPWKKLCYIRQNRSWKISYIMIKWLKEGLSKK